MSQAQTFFEKASDVQLRAVRIVRIAVRLMNFIAIQQGLRQYTINNMRLHEHFPEFVMILHLTLSDEERVNYYSSFGGKRRVVLYYEQAHGYTSEDGLSAPETIMRCSSVLSENFTAEILEEAKAIGVSETACEFNHLLLAANALLKKVRV